MEHGKFEFVKASWDRGKNMTEILELFRVSSQWWNWEVFW